MSKIIRLRHLTERQKAAAALAALETAWAYYTPQQSGVGTTEDTALAQMYAYFAA